MLWFDVLVTIMHKLIQGPNAQKILQRHTAQNLEDIAYYHFTEGKVCGVEQCIIARTGYTGEDGFEVFIPLQRDLHDGEGAVLNLWTTILESGKEDGIVPVGLGARDTLRMEANMNLYGNDMDDETSPYESGLGWSVKITKSDFIGKACRVFKNNHWKQRQVNLIVDKKSPVIIARCGIVWRAELKLVLLQVVPNHQLFQRELLQN